MAWTGQPYASHVTTITITSVGLRSPSSMVPRRALNVCLHVLQRYRSRFAIMKANIALSDLASCATRQIWAKLVRRVHWLGCGVLHTHIMPRTVFLFKGFPPLSPVNGAVPSILGR